MEINERMDAIGLRVSPSYKSWSDEGEQQRKREIREQLTAIRHHIEEQDAVIVYLANSVEHKPGQSTDDIIKDAIEEVEVKNDTAIEKAGG